MSTSTSCGSPGLLRTNQKTYFTTDAFYVCQLNFTDWIESATARGAGKWCNNKRILIETLMSQKQFNYLSTNYNSLRTWCRSKCVNGRFNLEWHSRWLWHIWDHIWRGHSLRSVGLEKLNSMGEQKIGWMKWDSLFVFWQKKIWKADWILER